MIDLDLLVILDRSGSMEHAKRDHEGGLRSFVEDQRAMAGDVRLTLVQFDTVNPCEIVYDRVPIAEVGAIDLVPRGGTPLLDAMGLAIAHLTQRQSVEPASRTLAMIVTDGEENASKEWDLARVKQLVTELETKGGQVLYLGANVDAFSEAGSVGVAHAHALNYNVNTDSIKAAYGLTSNKVLRSRQMVNAGASAMSVSASLDYTAEEQAQVSSGTVADQVTTSATHTPDDAA